MFLSLFTLYLRPAIIIINLQFWTPTTREVIDVRRGNDESKFSCNTQ